MKPKQKVLLFIDSLLITLLATRIYLHLFPFSNLNIGQYNIHHLYIGAFLLIVACTLLIVGLAKKLIVLLSGISSAWILDEIIYLIATDGSDLAYLTPISFWGMIILTFITLIIIAFIYFTSSIKRKQ